MPKGEINPNIRRLDPQELTIRSRLGDANFQSVYNLYVATFGGRKVAVKPFSRDPLQDEANVLYSLQGVNCVPELYGILSGAMRTPYGDLLPPGAIVEEFATGKDLTRAYVHYPAFLDVGYNPEPEIMSQLAAHFRESVKKGLLVRDFKSGELFLDFKPDATPKLTRVDYGQADYVVDKPDEPGSEYFVGDIVSRLLFLAERGGESPPLDLQFYDSKRRESSETARRLKNASQRLRTNGETSLPYLMDACVKGDFVNTDINTFSQFLNNLEEAAIDHGRFVSEGALKRRQKGLELILDSARRGGGATNIEEGLGYMLKTNPYNALILADHLGRVPDNLRVAIGASDDNYLKALMVLIDKKYAPKPPTNQPSQHRSLFGGLFK